MPSDHQTAPAPPDPQLRGREVLVAVCGGIAAYKVADLVSKLVQRGAGVSVVMTRSGRKFIAPLTFQALSGRPVRTDTFQEDSGDIDHIALTERASLMLVAPATANIIAKAATGICDDLVSLLIAASACPIVFCPAMNSRMWANPIAQENCRKLESLGHRFIGPESGFLACRHVGPGRMSDPQKIVDAVAALLADPSFAAKPAPDQPSTQRR